MANRTTHLTHLYIVSVFNYVWNADRPANEEAIRALHGVAERLNAFPGWVEVMVSSHMGTRCIQFLRRRAGGERSQSFKATRWLAEFEGYGIRTQGWIREK